MNTNLNIEITIVIVVFFKAVCYIFNLYPLEMEYYNTI